MNRFAKLLLGIATLWPVVYVFGFMTSMFALAISGMGAPGSAGARSGMPSSFVWLFAVHGLTILGSLVLIAFYVVNVFRNERVVGDRKVLLAVVLFMGGMIAMPIYWYLYIWTEPTVASPTLAEPSAASSSDSASTDGISK